MKAITIIPGTTTVELKDREEPTIVTPDEIKIQMRRVGICGTDREVVAGGRSLAPDGRNELIIGHEMFGQVVEVGKGVTRVKPGDFAVFTDRRGCGECIPCGMNRSDMCNTGKFHERGIWGLDGFQTEYVVDKEQYVVCVPAELEPVGVLTEPLSVAEKAIDEAIRVQIARLPDAQTTPDWLFERRCLVAGLGPIGLLAAVALSLRGAEVYGLDIVEPNSARPEWLEHIGGKYIDGRQVPVDRIDKSIGSMDLIFDATGVPKLEFNLLDALAYNGVYVVTGIPGGDRPLEIPGAELMRQLVLKNQLLLGSVNNPRAYFQMAVDDLSMAQLRWGDHIKKLITNRYPYTEFVKPLTQHEADEIKVVLEWKVWA